MAAEALHLGYETGQVKKDPGAWVLGGWEADYVPLQDFCTRRVWGAWVLRARLAIQTRRWAGLLAAIEVTRVNPSSRLIENV
jgi:hypothetical protein